MDIVHGWVDATLSHPGPLLPRRQRGQWYRDDWARLFDPSPLLLAAVSPGAGTAAVATLYLHYRNL